MSVTQIVCANCGAKYKLPESFRGDRAKCKKCGQLIDVAAQRAQAAAPPARERPSGDRERPTGRRATGAGAGRARRQDSKTRRSEGGRRGRQRTKDSSTVLLVGSAVGVLAVVVVVLILLLNGGSGEEPPQKTAQNTTLPTPSNTTAKEGKVAAENAAARKPAAAAAGAAKSAEAQTLPPAAGDSRGAAGGVETAKAPEAEAPKAETAKGTKKKKGRSKKKVSKKKLMSRADVFDPKKELQPLEWPDIYDQAHRERVARLIEQVRGGGLSGARAKRELEKLGHGALVGIINALREVDYLDPEQTMFAYELNRLLQSICVEIINTRFRPQELDAEISLEDADWNAKTVKAWQRLWQRYADPEDFKRLIEKLRRRHVGK